MAGHAQHCLDRGRRAAADGHRDREVLPVGHRPGRPAGAGTLVSGRALAGRRADVAAAAASTRASCARCSCGWSSRDRCSCSRAACCQPESRPVRRATRHRRLRPRPPGVERRRIPSAVPRRVRLLLHPDSRDAATTGIRPARSCSIISFTATSILDDPTALDYGYERAYADLTRAHAIGRAPDRHAVHRRRRLRLPALRRSGLPRRDGRRHRDRSGGHRGRAPAAGSAPDLAHPLVQPGRPDVPEGMDRPETVRRRSTETRSTTCRCRTISPPWSSIGSSRAG